MLQGRVGIYIFALAGNISIVGSGVGMGILGWALLLGSFLYLWDGGMVSYLGVQGWVILFSMKGRLRV